MPMQDAIFNMEEGRGKAFVQALGAGLGLLLLVLVYFFTQFRGLTHDLAMDQAQVARHVAQGKGFTTSHLRPIALWQVLEHKRGGGSIDYKSFPDTLNPPAYPMALGLLLKVTFQDFKFTKDNLESTQVYAPDRIIAVFGLLCFGGAALLLFFIALNLFDFRVALLSVVLLLGTDLVWQFSLSGLDTAWLMLLLCGFFWSWQKALAREEPDENGALGSSMGWILLGAGFLSLMMLTRYACVWLMVPALLFAAFSFRQKTTALFLVTGILLMPSLFWWLRNVSITGNPLGAAAYAPMQSIDFLPGPSVWGEFQPDFSKLTIKMMGRNWVSNFRTQFENLPALSGGVILFSLAFITLLHRFKRFRTESLKWLLFGCLLFWLVGSSFSENSGLNPYRAENGVIVLVPILALFASAFFFLMLDRMGIQEPLFRNAAVFLLVGLHAFPFLLTVLPPPAPPVRFPPYYPAMLFLSSSFLSPQEVMCSDLSASTAWYGDRVSLFLPNRVESLNQINQKYLKGGIKGLLLSPQVLDTKIKSDVMQGRFKDWSELILARGIPQNLPFTAATFLPPQNAYFFMSDSERWKNPQTAPQGQK